jgi:membrane-associated phospholipid phosphatase
MSPPPRRPSPSVLRSLLAWGALAGVATLLCFVALDQPVARWLSRWEPSPLWGRLLSVIDMVGGLSWPKRSLALGPVTLDVTRWALALALGITALIATALPSLRSHARAWWFLTLVHLGSRLAMVELKEATGRLRPSDWLPQGGPSFFVDGGLSFPSGHVTYYFGLVLPLVLVLPRPARWLLLIPALVATCRVAVNAHFLGDVFGAVALVLAVAALLSPLLGASSSGSRDAH